MSFKIADAYVAVTPDDTATLGSTLRTKIEAAITEATDGLEATIGLGLTADAPEDLRADLDSAILLSEEDLEVRVGLGLTGDAPEELDLDVKAALALAEEDAKVRVKIDASQAQAAGDGLSTMLIGAFVAAGTIGPAALLEGTALGLVGVEALIAKSNTTVAADYTKLGATAKAAVEQAVAPLTTDIEASVGTLQQGVTKLKPQIASLFADVAPDAEAVANAGIQFADKALPGIESGLVAIKPYMSDLADDAGKIGAGIGGFFSGLGTGASGGASGLSALTSLIQQLLPDVGQLIGAFSNGLGPALQDVVDVAGPTAKVLADVVSAVPPGVIETAADAVAALFAAFKIGSLVGLVDGETSFLGFVKNLGPAAVETGEEVEGMGASAAGAAMKIGLILVGAGMLGEQLGKLSGVGASTGTVPQLTGMLLAAGDGADKTQQQLIDLADAMSIMGQVSQGQAAQGLATVDQALGQLYATDPKTATSEFNAMSAAMKANGATTAQIAADFPAYTAAVQDAKNATTENGQAQLAATSYAQTFAAAVATQTTALQAQAVSLAVNTTAANDNLPAQSQLSQAAVNAEIAYQGASTAATSYTDALNSLYGKYGDTSQAQAALTTGLAGLAGQITHGTNAVDLNTAAGAKNFSAFQQVAQAGETYSEKLYEQTQNAGLANQALQTSATNLDKVAAKAGLTKTQIAQLNTELYGVPAVKDIQLTTNAPTVSHLFTELQQQLDQLSQGASMNISTNMGGAKAITPYASGGHTAGREPIVVGDGGVPEVFIPDGPGTIAPSISAANSMMGSSGSSLGSFYIGALNLTMNGFADFTDPNSMSVAGRKMIIQLSNALVQLTRSGAGAFA